MSDTIADLLLDRLGDEHPGLLSHDRSWTWDEVVRESAARAELARSLRVDGPFHIGVLLENVPEFMSLARRRRPRRAPRSSASTTLAAAPTSRRRCATPSSSW